MARDMAASGWGRLHLGRGGEAARRDGQMTATVEDSTLLQRAQAGDVRAFEELLERHRDHVYGLAYRMLQSADDAAEVTQESFLAAFRNLGQFRQEAAFGSWVHRIAANHALMRLRHRKVVLQIEEPLPGPEFNERGSLIDEVADWGPDALERTLDAELRDAIARATGELPEDHRQVFLLRDVEGLSYEQIAELTESTVAAVKSRLHRARLALRTSIDRFYKEREA